MIVLKMKMVISPEKQVEFLKALQGIMETTRVESGCIGCHLYQNIRNENIFTLLEEWESRADLNDHLRRDTFKMLFPLMDHMSEPLESRIEYVSDSSGVHSLAGNSLERDDEPKRRWNFDSPVLPHPSRLFLDRVFRVGFTELRCGRQAN
jgi:quinol monooxygenase YgiN